MQGCVVRRQAPLGLLLVCLHLTGKEAMLALGRERPGGPGELDLWEGGKAGWCTCGSLGEVRVGFGEVNQDMSGGGQWVYWMPHLPFP